MAKEPPKESKIVELLKQKGLAGEDEALDLLKSGDPPSATDSEGVTPLFEAISHECVQLVRMLVNKSGGEVNKQVKGTFPLHNACRVGNLKIAKNLCDKKADICKTNAEGRTPLAEACAFGAWDIADDLLNNNADVHEKDTSGDNALTLLHKGMLYGKIEKGNTFVPAALLDSLIKSGADANSKNQAGESLLLLMCADEEVNALGEEWDGSIEAIKSLIKSGAEVNINHPRLGTPLIGAIRARSMCSMSVVKILCENNVNRSAVAAESNEWPLLCAAADSSTEVCDILLEGSSAADITYATTADCETGDLDCAGQHVLHASFLDDAGNPNLAHLVSCGALINTPDDNGNTPLHTACLKGRWNMAEILIEKQADLKARNKVGDTPLLSCLLKNPDLPTVRALISAGSSPNEAAQTGERPLHRAVTLEDTALIETLLTAKAEIDGDNGTGLTPLGYACTLDDGAKCAELLLEQGANVLTRDNETMCTPLLSVASRNPSRNDKWTPFLEQLLAKITSLPDDERDEHLHVQDSTESNALSLAIKNDNADVLNMLCQAGVKPSPDKNGNSAMHFAVQNGSMDVMNLLLSFTESHNTENVQGETPVYFLKSKDDLASANLTEADMVALLDTLDQAVPMLFDHCSNDGTTPLMSVIKKGYDNIALHVIGKAPQTAGMMNGAGESALTMACQQKMWNVVSELLKHNVNVNGHDEEGDPPAMKAIDAGEKAIVEQMIEKGLNVGATNKDGVTVMVRMRQAQLMKDKIVVEFCVDCEEHQWTTRHDASKYMDMFNMVKSALEGDGYEVFGNPPPPGAIKVKPKAGATDAENNTKNLWKDEKNNIFRYPALGAFEVYLLTDSDKILLFSKIKLGYWPSCKALRRSIDRASRAARFPDQVEARPGSALSEPGVGKSRSMQSLPDRPATHLGMNTVG